MQCDSWDVEPSANGAVLVRVHSCDETGHQLPDAVFTFRAGDPQYDYWAEKLLQDRTAQRSRPTASQTPHCESARR